MKSFINTASLVLLLFTLLNSTQYFGQDYAEGKKVDSLKEKLMQENLDDTTFINLSIELGETTPIFRIPYWDSIINFTKESLTKSKDKTTKNTLQKSLAGALNDIGYIYRIKGIFPKAVEYYHKSIKLQEIIGNKKGLATCLNNIGAIYSRQNNFPKALEYYHKSLTIREEVGDKRGIASSLNNLGTIYRNQNNTQKALKYYQKSLEIQEEINYKRGIASSLNNLGIIYYSQGEFHKALENYNKSLTLSTKISYNRGIIVALYKIGDLQYKQGDIVKAKENALKSLKLSQDISLIENIKSAAELLSKIYKKEGKGMQAFEMYKLFVSMKDSIENKKNIKATIQQQMRYEYEKQALSDSIANAEAMKVKDTLLKAKELENKQQKQQKYFLFGGLALLAIFAVFVVNRLQVTNKQKAIIEQQKEQVELTHKEITDSINYAKRLQNAILPSFDEINEYIPDNFILFQPKDVVSGDFYWFEHKNNSNLLAVADCTGHGVPGAMVSVVCANALYRTVNEFQILTPAKILDKTRELVIETFAKSSENIKDGMDIALCSISNNKVMFSGANNPLWIIRYKKHLTEEQKQDKNTYILEELALIEFKGDRQPVGMCEKMRPFTQTEIELFPNDTLYLFTDGFSDQFGGERGKKFKYKPFKKKLIEISTLPMNEQKEIILETFKAWKGDLEQVDDVCIVGVKIS